MRLSLRGIHHSASRAVVPDSRRRSRRGVGYDYYYDYCYHYGDDDDDRRLYAIY